MQNKENRPKLLSCMIKGPAPKYKLQPLVGYEGHCLSRQRGPAYTIRPRTQIRIESIGPGPRYNVSKLTNYGVDRAPGYTIAGREPFKVRDFGPGPGAHYPELCPPMNHNIRGPAYSIKSRSRTKLIDIGPGPNAYFLPTCIGPKIPDKIAQGAFSIAGIHKLREDHIGPGPAAYTNIRSDLIKRSAPAFSLKWRTELSELDLSPGPRYYPAYNTRKRSPMYSFGIRHSECAGLPITDLDEGPGPKYKLKTLVGYQEHCLSKYRNPAYTFGNRHPSLRPCEGPGPKYLLADAKRDGFTFGLIGKTFDTSCGPGPKYFLPSPKTPAFSLKSRTEYRKTCFTPGPYSIKFPRQGPAFYIGRRLPALKCDPVPGPRLYSDHLVRQRSPTYHIACRIGGKEICRSPGPKYYLKLPKSRPMFSFGIKHSECAPPYIVECDDQC